MQKFPKDPDMYVFFGDLPYKSILWRCDLDWHPGALGVDPNPTNGPQKPSRWSSGRLFFHVDRMIFGVEQHFLFLSVEQPGGLTFEKIKKSIHIYDYNYEKNTHFFRGGFCYSIARAGCCFHDIFFSEKKVTSSYNQVVCPCRQSIVINGVWGP